MSKLAFLNHYGGLKCLKCDFVIYDWSLLVPSLNGQVKSGSDQTGPSGDDKAKHNFVLHWLNNKEMEFTVQAEKIMEDLLKMALEKDDVSAEAFGYELTHPDKVHTKANYSGPEIAHKSTVASISRIANL